MIRALCSLLCLLGCLLPPPLALAGEDCRIEAPGEILVLEDAHGELDPQTLGGLPAERFWRLEPGLFPIEYSHSVFWLRFSTRTSGSAGCDFWLSLGEPRLDEVQVYWRQGEGWQRMRAGRSVPLAEWPSHSRYPLFPLPQTQDEPLEVLARVASRTQLMIEPRLYTEGEQLLASEHAYMRDGLVLGIVLLVVPFGLLVALLIRSALVLNNSLSVFAYVLLCCVVNGYLFYWPALMPWAAELVSLLSAGTLLLLSAYIYVLFGMRRLPALWGWLLALYSLAMGGLLLSGLFVDFVATRQWFSALRSFYYLVIPLLALVVWLHGLRLSWLAWLMTGFFVLQGGSRLIFEMRGVSWQYGEDQLGLPSSLPGVLLLCCTLVMEFARSRQRERRAFFRLDNLLKRESERLESTVTQRTEQLRESLRARSSLLASISHDLRAPLAGIVEYARLLGEESRDEQPRRIENNALRQLEMIDELLEFSRSELQQQELILAPGYLYAFLREIEGEAEFLALRQGHRLDCRFSANLPLLVRADFRRLRRVLLNLLGNSARFRRDGRIAFTVDCLEDGAGEAVLAFSISDSGGAIEPSARMRGETLEGLEKSDLGLSIVAQLLLQMESRLELDSGAGWGKRFSFHLGLQRASEDELDSVLGEGRRATVFGDGQRVLVVDDMELNREALTDLLGGYGFDVWGAADAEDALELLEQQPFDLLIVDQMMPGLGGWGLLSSVRALYPGLPALLYSAAPPLRPSSCDPGLAFDAALLKPADAGEMLDQIARLLQAPLVEVGA